MTHHKNPVEDVWLYAKNFMREFYHLCKSFSHIKRLFDTCNSSSSFLSFRKYLCMAHFFTQFLHGIAIVKFLHTFLQLRVSGNSDAATSALAITLIATPIT